MSLLEQKSKIKIRISNGKGEFIKMNKINMVEMDRDYFIKDCLNCEHVQIVSIDKITIDKMYCGLTKLHIVNSKLLCENFKISESAKIVKCISDNEAKRIEKEVKE